MTTSKKTSENKGPKNYQTRGMLIREMALKVTNFAESTEVAKDRIKAFDAKYEQASTEEEKALHNVLDNVEVVSLYSYVHGCDMYPFKYKCFRAIASALDDNGNCIADFDQITNIAAYTSDALWTLRVNDDPYEAYNPEVAPDKDSNEVSDLLFTASGEPKLLTLLEAFSTYQCYEASKCFVNRPVTPCEAACIEFVRKYGEIVKDIVLATNNVGYKFYYHTVAHEANDMVTPQLEITRNTFNNKAAASFVKLLGLEYEIKLDANYIFNQFDPHELDDMTYYDLDFVEYDVPSESDKKKLANFAEFLNSPDAPNSLGVIRKEILDDECGEDKNALYKMAAWFDDICKLEEVSKAAHFHELGKLITLLSKMIKTTIDFGYDELFPSYRDLITLINQAQGTKDLLKKALRTKNVDSMVAKLFSNDMQREIKPLAKRYKPQESLFEDVRLKARYKNPFIDNNFYALVDELVAEKKLDKDGRLHLIKSILFSYLGAYGDDPSKIRAMSASELRKELKLC